MADAGTAPTALVLLVTMRELQPRNCCSHVCYSHQAPCPWHLQHQDLAAHQAALPFVPINTLPFVTCRRLGAPSPRNTLPLMTFQRLALCAHRALHSLRKPCRCPAPCARQALCSFSKPLKCLALCAHQGLCSCAHSKGPALHALRT